MIMDKFCFFKCINNVIVLFVKKLFFMIYLKYAIRYLYI